MTIHARSPRRSSFPHVSIPARFSTNAPLAIEFSTQDPWQPIQKLTDAFRNHVWNSISAAQCLPELQQTYQVLRRQVDALRARDPHAALQLQKLMSISDWNDTLEALAQYGGPQDITFLNEVIADMPTIFSRTVTADTHTTVLRGLLKRPGATDVLAWLARMHQKPGQIKPTIEHWTLVLAEYEERREYDHMWRAFDLMEEKGVRHQTLYRYLLRAVFNSHRDPMKGVLRIIDCMATGHLPFDGQNLAIIVDGFTSQGKYEEADQAEDAYRSRVGGRPDVAVSESDNRDDYLAQTVRRDGRQRATKLYRSFLTRGWRPTHKTLLAVLRGSCNPNDLLYWEGQFEVSGGPDAWTLLIRNSVTLARPMHQTASIYSAALNAGISPSFKMVEPLIRGLCSSSIRAPDEKSLDTAIGLYHAVSQANTPTKGATDFFRGPEVIVCNTLLRAMISSTNHAKYFPKAMSIFEDLRQRKVPLDRMAITSLVILAMKSSTSFNEAFDVYKHLLSRFHGQFDARSFTDIIIAFGRLRFDNRTIPPWRSYFDIVHDMREAGFPTTQFIYTEILRQLARTSEHISPSEDSELYSQLILAIKETHHFLVMDPFITPDTACLNQLMDTYQRGGMFTEARQVWDSMQFSGKVDAISVNIVMDACGHKRAPAAAKEIFEGLRRDGHKFTPENWRAWVECLCRLGEIEEATKLVFLEMAKDNPHYKPDVECIRILHKFSKEYPVPVPIQERVKQYYPDFVRTLPYDVFD